MDNVIKQKLSDVIKLQFTNGRKPWNKGLTKEDHRVKKNTEKAQKTIKERGSLALENNPRWKGGKCAYKNMALKHYGNSCMLCGKEDKRPKMIHVHHKDGNRNNNNLCNLEVLCSKCHRSKHPQKASELQKQIARETHLGKPKTMEQKIKMSEARKLWWKNKKLK